MSNEKRTGKIIIRVGRSTMEVQKSELRSFEAVPDGMAITTNTGLRIHIDDEYLPLELKNKILMAYKFTGDVTIDFNNRASPISVVSK